MTREEYYAKYPHRNIHDKAFDPAKHPRFKEYVWNRLSHVNEDGSLSTHDSILYDGLDRAMGKYGEGHDQFMPETSDGSEDEDILLSDLFYQGIITRQPEISKVNIPAFVAKKFDPYYKDYFKTGKAVLDRIRALTPKDVYGDEGAHDRYLWRNLSKSFNLRGLLNLHKIANDKDFYEAIEEANRFNLDFPDYEGQFNSLNELRAAPAKIAEEKERAQDLEDIVSDLIESRDEFSPEQREAYKQASRAEDPDNRGYNMVRKVLGTDPLFEDLRNLYVKKIRAQRQSPYDKLTIETKKLAEANGWKVLSSPQELDDVGKDLIHCYSSKSKFGRAHHKEYSRRCRNVDTVLVTNGEVTAEILINGDGNAKIGQIMAYNDKPVRLGDPRTKGLENIVTGISNMTKQEVSSKDMKIIHDAITRGKGLGL